MKRLNNIPITEENQEHFQKCVSKINLVVNGLWIIIFVNVGQLRLTLLKSSRIERIRIWNFRPIRKDVSCQIWTLFLVHNSHQD